MYLRYMFKKGNVVKSIVGMKCPRCQEGNLYVTRSAYSFKNWSKMHERCLVCEQKFELEPSFYYGSMYVSYAFTVALFIAIWIIGSVFMNLNIISVVAILAVVSLILAPYIFRLSRSTWIHLFVKFAPNYLLKKRSTEQESGKGEL